MGKWKKGKLEYWKNGKLEELMSCLKMENWVDERVECN